MKSIFFKLLVFLTKIFSGPVVASKATLPAVVPHLLSKDKVKKKNVKRGTPVTRTAVQCLICGSRLMRSPGNPFQISYTCSKICRKLLRGGKDNSRILKRWLIERKYPCNPRQRAMYQKQIKWISRTSRDLPDPELVSK